MERNLHKVVSLLRKAYSGNLGNEEKEQVEELLKDEHLQNVYSEVGDDTYLEKHFADYQKYSPERAYEMFRTKQRKERMRLIMRRCAVAACLIVPLLGVCLWMMTGDEKPENIVHMTDFIRKENIQLKLSDGTIVNMIPEGNSEIEEKGGTLIHYEAGKISYEQKNEPVAGAVRDEYNELIVPLGGECYVVLDDGTRVWLNAGSRMKYPVRFSGESRNVSVKGEVYFDVTKEDRPFIVKTALGDVKVLGTSFGVRAYPGEDVLTTLVTGKVMFTAEKGTSVTLSPGEQSVISLTGDLTKRTVNVEEYVGWKDGWYIFKEKRLEDVMQTLTRWYDITVFYQNPRVKDITFTGNLKRYDSIHKFLEVLAGSGEIKYKIDGNMVILYE